MFTWYAAALRKYFVFSGRAGKSEVFSFYGLNIAMEVALWFAFQRVGGNLHFLDWTASWASLGANAGVVADLILSAHFGFTAFILIPMVSVAVRRLHDTGNTGWLYLINFIPVIGNFAMLVLLAFDSQPNDNKYGPRLTLVVDSAPLAYPSRSAKSAG